MAILFPPASGTVVIVVILVAMGPAIIGRVEFVIRIATTSIGCWLFQLQFESCDFVGKLGDGVLLICVGLNERCVSLDKQVQRSLLRDSC